MKLCWIWQNTRISPNVRLKHTVKITATIISTETKFNVLEQRLLLDICRLSSCHSLYITPLNTDWFYQNGSASLVRNCLLAVNRFNELQHMARWWWWWWWYRVKMLWPVQMFTVYSPLTWGIYSDPPPDIPECGFIGELCPPSVRGKLFHSFNMLDCSTLMDCSSYHSFHFTSFDLISTDLISSALRLVAATANWVLHWEST